MEQVEGAILSEEARVMYTTAKKVLKRFWKPSYPVDAEMQTDFSVIDSLKEQISRLELIIEERDAVIKNLRFEKDNLAESLTALNLRYTANKKSLNSKNDELNLLIAQVENLKQDVIYVKKEKQATERKLKETTDKLYAAEQLNETYLKRIHDRDDQLLKLKEECAQLEINLENIKTHHTIEDLQEDANSVERLQLAEGTEDNTSQMKPLPTKESLSTSSKKAPA